MDSDGNGKPDFLDFTGVPQYHMGDTVATSNFRAAATLADSADLHITVPSMVWFKELRPEENPNIFSVALEAGKTYTVEFSKNFTEALDDILPNIKIYDPKNAAIDPDVPTDDFDKVPVELNVAINTYPVEHPSVICYTFKASVSGNYIITVADAEPSTINLDSETAATGDTVEVSTASVMFIYEERFNNDEANEPGYYTRFKIADAEGNKSDTMSVRDVIQLRKEFLKVNPDYFTKVYGYDMPDDEYGAGETESYDINEASGDNYNSFMNIVQGRLGFVEAEETYGDSDEFGDDPYAVTKKLPTLKGKRSEIPATVTGIPYDDTYELGMGFAAITNLSPVGGIQALDNFEDKLFEGVKSKNLPLATEYYASFVSTREEAEGLTKTNLNASLSKNALGASYSTGSTNSYKFGLTATNLVIHYEVKETKYRTLKNADFIDMLAARSLRSIKQYSQDKMAEEPLPDTIKVDQYGNEDDLFEEASVKAAADDNRKVLDLMLSLEPDFFRTQFGDYFVCGYQYGACFDAYISISTQTSETLREVKQKITASGSYNGVTASGDFGKDIKNTLKDSKAEVTIRIVTNGMGEGPVEIPLTNSTDINAMDDVFTQLLTFRNKIAQDTKREHFAPIRVAMKRWRSLADIGFAFMEKGDVGTIPISVEHATNIQGFNTALVNLRAHRNFIMGVGENIEPAKTLDESFAKVVGLVTDGGNDFYSDLDAMAQALEVVHELDDKFKMLGDRYVFYKKLVQAQKAEKATYNDLKDKAEKAGGKDDEDSDKYKYIRKMPFGAEHGGSSGYDSFAVSKWVTEDINAGKKSKKRYQKDASPMWRTEWKHNQRDTNEKGEKDYDYIADVGPATISADLKTGKGNTEDARFCKVWVRSTATSSELDNKRELADGAPAVGKKSVGFEFMGGGSRNVDWTIEGQAIRMRQQDYPFDGLE